MGREPTAAELGVTQGFHLAFADGSEPNPGGTYALESYRVELVAEYPSGYVGYVRWELPGPGATSQFGDQYGVIEDREVTGALESEPTYQAAQFTDDGSTCSVL